MRNPFSLAPDRLWYLSIALRKRGHRRLAYAVKRLNALLYHNSLSPDASVGAGIKLGHHAFGVMINHNVEIGKRVGIKHHVTLTAREASGKPAKLIIGDDVRIGAHAVIVAPRGGVLRVGRGAKIGAGVVVTKDVPAGASVVSAPARVITDHAEDRVERLEKMPAREDEADASSVA